MHGNHGDTRGALVGSAITYGFAAAFIMGAAAYAAHFGGLLHTPSPVVGAGLIAILLALSALAGRRTPIARAWKIGAGVGLVAGLAAIVGVGSLVSEVARDDRPSPGVMAMFFAGWTVFTTLAGAASASLAAKVAPASPRNDESGAAWLGRFAIVTAFSGLVLLALGGIVTSTEQGLAVPDWPQSFGANMFLYPLSQMTGGIFIEHAHRLYAALVGLATTVLMVFTLVVDRRAWVKAVAAIAFVLVCVQGILGGLRVTEQSDAMAMVHGVLAQVFVTLLFVIAAMLSDTWRSARPPIPSPSAKAIHRASRFAVAALLIQVAFGAATRHFDLQIHALVSHLVWAIVVAVAIIVAGMLASRRHGDEPILRKCGRAPMHTLGLQIVLGVVALGTAMFAHDQSPPPLYDVAAATAHQVVGAVLLIGVTLLAAWSTRLLEATA